MALGTFLAGCTFGALLATLLTLLDDITSIEIEVPLSFSMALTQIAAGWARPASLSLALLRHPLLLCCALALLLGARKMWRSCILRPLWVHTPIALKSTLEMHAGVLGFCLLCTLVLAAQAIAYASEVGVGRRTAKALYECTSSRGQGVLSLFRRGRASMPLAVCSSVVGYPPPALATFHPIWQALAIQALLPFFTHPGLAPSLLGWTLRRGQPGRGAAARLCALVGAAYHDSRRVRDALRLAYGTVLLLSILWALPLTFDAGTRWWREEVIVYLGRFLGSLPAAGHTPHRRQSEGATLEGRTSTAFDVGLDSGVCSAHERAKAVSAANTLRALALFSALRCIGKTLDLQIGHYYGRGYGRSQAGGQAGGPTGRTPIIAARFGSAGLQSSSDGSGRALTVTVGRSDSILRRFGAPRWLKSYVRSLRWLCVSVPTYVFWYALSVEQSSSCAWRRLLLPTLLFALRECAQTARLLALLVVHEGRTTAHEHLRLRSYRWFHRLEVRTGSASGIERRTSPARWWRDLVWYRVALSLSLCGGACSHAVWRCMPSSCAVVHAPTLCAGRRRAALATTRGVGGVPWQAARCRTATDGHSCSAARRTPHRSHLARAAARWPRHGGTRVAARLRARQPARRLAPPGLGELMVSWAA